jgi:WD40 repeat protein
MHGSAGQQNAWHAGPPVIGRTAKKGKIQGHKTQAAKPLLTVHKPLKPTSSTTPVLPQKRFSSKLEELYAKKFPQGHKQAKAKSPLPLAALQPSKTMTIAKAAAAATACAPAAAVPSSALLLDCEECNTLLTDDSSREQVMLVHLLDQRAKKYSTAMPISLKTCARHIGTMEKTVVTTRELARTLLTFSPETRNRLLTHHTVHTDRERPNKDGTTENYLNALQAFQATQSILPLSSHHSIKKVLSEYVFDEMEDEDPANAVHNTPADSKLQQEQKKHRETTQKSAGAVEQYVQPISLPASKKLWIPNDFYPDTIENIVWSPDGKHLAIVSAFHAKIWDVRHESASSCCWHQKKEYTSPPGDRYDYAYGPSIAWNSDSTRVALEFRGDVHFIDLQNRRKDSYFSVPEDNRYRHYKRLKNPSISLAWSANDVLAIAADEAIWIYNAASNEINRLTKLYEPKASNGCYASLGSSCCNGNCTSYYIHNSPVNTILCWNPEGTRLAMAAAGTAYVWHFKTGKRVDLSDGKSISSIACSPDGTYIATVSGKDICIWDWETGTKLHTLPHPNPVSYAQWSPDGTQLATVTNADSDSTVYLWDARLEMKQVAIIEYKKLKVYDYYTQNHKHKPVNISWSPDSSKLALRVAVNFDTGGHILIWNALSHSRVSTLPYCNQCTWHPSSRKIATTNGVWDVESGKQLYAIYGNHNVKGTSAVCWNQDGSKLAGISGSVLLWEPRAYNLFQAIEAQDSEAVDANLDLSTIAAQDPANKKRTPLMLAICFGRSQTQKAKAIFERILNFGKDPRYDQFDLSLTDADYNTPLRLAMSEGCYNYALQIAQMMDEHPALHEVFSTGYPKTYDVVETQNKDNLGYQKLIKLLKKHDELYKKKNAQLQITTNYMHRSFYDKSTQKNTPLILAIKEKRFADALLIAQILDEYEWQRVQFAVEYDNEGTAYDIAQRMAEEYKNNPDYQELMKLLEAKNKWIKEGKDALEKGIAAIKKRYSSAKQPPSLDAPNHMKLIQAMQANNFEIALAIAQAFNRHPSLHHLFASAYIEAARLRSIGKIYMSSPLIRFLEQHNHYGQYIPDRNS